MGMQCFPPHCVCCQSFFPLSPAANIQSAPFRTGGTKAHAGHKSNGHASPYQTTHNQGHLIRPRLGLLYMRVDLSERHSFRIWPFDLPSNLPRTQPKSCLNCVHHRLAYSPRWREGPTTRHSETRLPQTLSGTPHSIRPTKKSHRGHLAWIRRVQMTRRPGFLSPLLALNDW
jgi:hypothetical protein